MATSLQQDQLLADSHISLCPHPAHPDLDIVPPGAHTIQIGLPPTTIPSPHANLQHSTAHSRLLIHTANRALVYRPDGTFIASLAFDCLAWLRSRYDCTKQHLPDLFLKHGSGSFEQDIARLLIRHRPRDKLHDYNGKAESHWPIIHTMV